MTHLKIELNNGIIEEVSSAVIDKLYDIVHNGNLDNTSNLIGRLHTSTTYQDYINYLEDTFKINGVKLLIIDANKKYISFADPEVLRVLVTEYGDGIGVTQSELANVNEILLLFKGNTNITSFNEFRYFTGINHPDVNWQADWFTGCTNLREVTIPKNVVDMRSNSGCFSNCTSLLTVTFDPVSSVKKLTGFFNCTSLVNISIPDSVETIEGECFRLCSSLLTINTKNATILGGNAFKHCSSLTSATILNAEEIGNECFYADSNLTSVNFDSSKITTLRREAFAGCSKLVIDDLSLPNLETLETGVFDSTKIKAVSNLGTQITSIPDYTFHSCSQLISVILPLTVTSIGRNAFQGCISLDTIDLSSCTTIGQEAFKGCTSLQTVSGFSNITSLNNSIFYGCTNLQNINGIDWSKITNIETYAFYLCSNLTLSNVNLSNVTSINSSAFYGSGITSISNISAGTTLSSQIFRECKSLISATNINKVGNSMFKDCSNLTIVSIGSSISNIPGGLFENCSNLVSPDINFQNITTIDQNSFLNCSKLEFSSPIDLSNVTSIGTSSFQNCSKVIIDKFPKASIYLTACFSNIGNTTITIPKEVQQLKNLCFGNNVNLQTVLFEVDSDPQLVSQLTYMLNTFRGCSNLEGPLSIPEGVTTLDGMNFFGCSNLTSVTLPSTLTSMANGEFLYSGVTSLTIKATTPPTITNQSLGWMSNSLIIYVPSESVSAYLSALYWNSYASKILAIP